VDAEVRPSGAPAIGVLGGTFDPVHLGHVAMAEAARDALNLDRVLLLPTAIPPHKVVPGLTSGAHRVAMLRLAVKGREGLEVCTLELETGGVCFTIDTLRRLREGPPACRPVFVLGTDSLLEIDTWREHEALLREFDLAVIERPGSDLDGSAPGAAGAVPEIDPPAGEGGRVFRLPMRPLPISSTQVRGIAADGGSLDGLVAPAVSRYIRANRLYGQEDQL
jgi:nicotinate-nucleotide adenylyltransferase